MEKTSALIQQGVHLLVIDLFPPTNGDPMGIHKAIWDEFEEEDFELPPEQPLVCGHDVVPPRWRMSSQSRWGMCCLTCPCF